MANNADSPAATLWIKTRRCASDSVRRWYPATPASAHATILDSSSSNTPRATTRTCGPKFSAFLSNPALSRVAMFTRMTRGIVASNEAINDGRSHATPGAVTPVRGNNSGHIIAVQRAVVDDQNSRFAEQAHARVSFPGRLAPAEQRSSARVGRILLRTRSRTPADAPAGGRCPGLAAHLMLESCGRTHPTVLPRVPPLSRRRLRSRSGRRKTRPCDRFV